VGQGLGGRDQRGRAGKAHGAVAGGALGSTVGGDWRARTAAGVGGALLGGLAGSAVERGVTQGQAVEFTIRPDGGGPDFTVVQTNELGFTPGERVTVSFGDRVRIARGQRDLGELEPPGSRSCSGRW
jgi:outer membrane lipoprotein SlyB